MVRDGEASAGVLLQVDQQATVNAELQVGSVTESVNVEDMRVEHATGQPLGIAEILVLPAAYDRLAAALLRRRLQNKRLPEPPGADEPVERRPA